ncbi:MAG: hypothetical protein QOE58_706, partial [Actinomycetota bacterium]|nr:hypothetical protein [Actinomycetota bacterium]
MSLFSALPCRSASKAARVRLAALMMTATSVWVGLPALAAPGGQAPHIAIQVLSGRPDLVSGNTALVAVRAPAAVLARGLVVRAGSRDVSTGIRMRPNGLYEGLVAGLPLGSSEITATYGRATARLRVNNHPQGGPLFAGPQMTPWVCQEGAKDRQCNAPKTFNLGYMPVALKNSGASLGAVEDPSAFRPYDPTDPPPSASVATTTTDQGITVPYIVRTETGFIDRDQYSMTTLYRPGRQWTPWSPQDQWNHKLLIAHGSSCGIAHTAGTAPSTMIDAALGRGFLVMSTAADNAGHNCDVVRQAESLVMAKELLTKEYGEIRYTIGTGCSGGSLTQQQVANAYPGIYQGILPQCSFPDAWTTLQQVEDDTLLRNYLENPTKWVTGAAWTPTQIAAVEGHPNHSNAVLLSVLDALIDPAAACAGVTASQQWSPSNKKGTRCTLQDFAVNIFGRRPDGYAGRAFDNVGVQYGLAALKGGFISPAQFIDLNQKIGS